MALLRTFWRDESGQDLIEYTLLIAFVALASAALFGSSHDAIAGIWKTNTDRLVDAESKLTN